VQSKLRLAAALLTQRERSTVTVDDARAYPWHQLDVDSAANLRRSVERYYPGQSARNTTITAVRGVVVQCHRVGLISALRRDEVLDELYTVAPGPTRRRWRLSAEDLVRLLAAAEAEPRPALAARDSAIIALLATSGMRIGELQRLELRDWNPQEGTLLVREPKNRRDHLVFVHPEARNYLHRWLRHRGSQPGPLFTAVQRRHNNLMHKSTFQHLKNKYERASGIKPFGLHDFRRSFATHMLRRHDPALVSQLLNHKHIGSTLVYDLAGEEAQRSAVASLTLRSPDEVGPRPAFGEGSIG
jgi:integrase